MLSKRPISTGIKTKKYAAFGASRPRNCMIVFDTYKLNVAKAPIE